MQLPNPLPPLREELRLQPASVHTDGSPAWTIQDPVANTFYRIGWLEFEFLSRWHLADPKQVLALTAKETILQPHEVELEAMLNFLSTHHLLADYSSQGTEKL